MIDLPVTLQIKEQGDPIPGLLRDVSRGGCLFTTSARLSSSPSVVAVAMSVKRGGRVMDCRAAGLVIRSQPGHGFGISLLQANDEFLAFVDDLNVLSPDLRREFLAQVLDSSIVID